MSGRDNSYKNDLDSSLESDDDMEDVKSDKDSDRTDDRDAGPPPTITTPAPVTANPRTEEEPPRRRQHKYTTANLQPERPWLRYFLICLSFLLILVIMILISIFLQKLFDPDEESDWSDDNVVSNVTDDDQAGALGGASANLLLPKDSKYLETVCAEDKLEGDSRAACEQVCAPAVDCCNPYSSSNNSTCFEQQTAGCVTYSQCHALEGTNDPAWNDLDRVCSQEGLDFNPTECEMACTALSCCYTDVDNCVGIHFQACLDYSPCQNLRSKLETLNGGAYIPVAESELEEQCRNGDPSCGQGCDEATCCADPNSDCYRDNFIACLTYATCNQFEDTLTKIRVAPIHSRVSAAPANIRDICLESYVATNGRAECEAACAPSECCFAEGVASCFGADPLACMQYRGCSVLRTSTAA
jgi:hypothetical protein